MCVSGGSSETNFEGGGEQGSGPRKAIMEIISSFASENLWENLCQTRGSNMIIRGGGNPWEQAPHREAKP